MNVLCSEFVGCDLGRRNSGVVKLTKNLEGSFIAVKTATIREAIGWLRREINSLKLLIHQLIVRIHEFSSQDVVVTELSKNGLLAGYLADSRNGSLSPLIGSTRLL
jgi:hypothetical protein